MCSKENAFCLITAQEIRVPVCYQQLSPQVTILSLKKVTIQSEIKNCAKKTQFTAREKSGRLRKDALRAAEAARSILFSSLFLPLQASPF